MKKLFYLILTSLIACGCSSITYDKSALLDLSSSYIGFNKGLSEINPVAKKIAGGGNNNEEKLVITLALLKYIYYKYYTSKSIRNKCLYAMKLGNAINTLGYTNNILAISGKNYKESIPIGLIAAFLQYKKSNGIECNSK